MATRARSARTMIEIQHINCFLFINRDYLIGFVQLWDLYNFMKRSLCVCLCFTQRIFKCKSYSVDSGLWINIVFIDLDASSLKLIANAIDFYPKFIVRREISVNRSTCLLCEWYVSSIEMFDDGKRIFAVNVHIPILLVYNICFMWIFDLHQQESISKLEQSN